MSSKKRKFIKSSVDRKQSKQISKLKREVKTLIKKTELKHNDDQAMGQSGITWLGHIEPLLEIPVWNANNSTRMTTREGLAINLKSLRVNATVEILADSSADSNPFNQMRVMCIRMTDDNKAPPVLTDIINTNLIGNKTTCYSYLAVNGKRRYQVLHDSTHFLSNPIGQQAAQGWTWTRTEPNRKRLKFSIKLPKTGLKVEYAQTVGGQQVLSPITNAIYMLFVSDAEPAPGSDLYYPQASFISRLRYEDGV